jgi:hypothetical protein
MRPLRCASSAASIFFVTSVFHDDWFSRHANFANLNTNERARGLRALCASFGRTPSAKSATQVCQFFVVAARHKIWEHCRLVALTLSLIFDLRLVAGNAATVRAINGSYIGSPQPPISTMATGAKKAVAAVKRSKKKAATSTALRSPSAKGKKKTARSEKDAAIATELAPAVAIALLSETDRAKGEPAAALEPLGAGAVASEVDGKLRVQLLFENGAVLPIEMTDAAAQALGKGIAKELQKG